MAGKVPTIVLGMGERERGYTTMDEFITHFSVCSPTPPYHSVSHTHTISTPSTQVHTSQSSSVLLVTVSHGDTLETVASLDRHGSLLHGESVVDGLIALVVQGSIQDSLEPEVSVCLLWMKPNTKTHRGHGGNG